jgi:DNA mismatch repair protein MutS
MYVPCTKFTYKPYRAIFTRILGNDNLFKGLSTFAVEMSELRLILKMADKNSLVLGDELCSGTEIESALSIFMAGLMALHKKEVSFIFATHFHEILKYDEMRELTKLSVKHLSVIYDRERDCLIYDRKLKPGSGSRMYGLEVCKSLYLPQEFLDCAYQLRAKYNSDSRGELKNPDAPKYNAAKIRGICEMCKTNIGEEIHHLQEQNLADKEGYIEGAHKNHAGNLMSICKSCHDSIHVPIRNVSEINIDLITNEVVGIIGKKSGNKMLKRKTTAGYIIGKG